MSLNELILNPRLVAQLYPSTLIQGQVGDSSPKQVPKVPPAPQVSQAPDYLGHFQQHILVLVKDAEAKFMGDDALSFLTKVLQACQLTLADVAIVNAAHGNTRPASLADLNPKVVLEFGTSFFGTDKPLYQPINTGFFSLVRALPIQQLLGNDPTTKQEKAKLWQALQAIFLHGK